MSDTPDNGPEVSGTVSDVDGPDVNAPAPVRNRTRRGVLSVLVGFVLALGLLTFYAYGQVRGLWATPSWLPDQVPVLTSLMARNYDSRLGRLAPGQWCLVFVRPSALIEQVSYLAEDSSEADPGDPWAAHYWMRVAQPDPSRVFANPRARVFVKVLPPTAPASDRAENDRFNSRRVPYGM